jgi:hypothetical protein
LTLATASRALEQMLDVARRAGVNPSEETERTSRMEVPDALEAEQLLESLQEMMRRVARASQVRPKS